MTSKPDTLEMPVSFTLDLIELIDVYAKKTKQAPKDAIAELIRYGLTFVAWRLEVNREAGKH